MEISNFNATAQSEYELLLKEAQDGCARRISSAATISAADAARSDLRWRIKRLDAMTDQQLVESAAKRCERAAHETLVSQRPQG